jgi:ubiquinone/menaquinone biosynthesis C-methylase UbiE
MVNKFIKFIGNNFGKPKGIIGVLMTKIMNIMNQKLYKSVLKNIKLETNNIILDIGFGNGYLIKKLFQKNIPIKIYGIEISNDMVNKVSLKNKLNIKNGKLTLLLENIEKTSFEDNTFDKIVTINTIYFWNNYEKCFSEIKRILKPNGIFLNLIYSKEFLDKIIYTKYGFKKNNVEEIIKITNENGMKIIETIEVEKNKSYCIISGMEI